MIPYNYALRELRRRKNRSIINIIGFIIVVATLITLVTTARAWDASTAEPLKEIGTDIILVYSAPVVPSGTGCFIVNHLFSFPFEQSSIEEIQDIEGVERVVPILMHRMGAVVLVGFDPEEKETNAILPGNIVEGRYLTSEDEKAAIVDYEYAKLNNLTIGSQISYIKGKFEIVGLANVDVANILKSHIYVNLPAGQKALPDDYTGLVNVALISINDPRDVKIISEELIKRWAGATPIAATDLASATSNILNIGEDTAWNISIIISIVAVLFIIRSQIATISERTREIGILKSIGWSKSNIINQIFIESTIQGALGGLIGCITGLCAVWYLLSTITGAVIIDPVVITFGFLIALLSSIIAGSYPAWKAAKLAPAKALRTI